MVYIFSAIDLGKKKRRTFKNLQSRPQDTVYIFISAYVFALIYMFVFLSLWGQRAEGRQINKKKHDIADINDQAIASVSECN